MHDRIRVAAAGLVSWCVLGTLAGCQSAGPRAGAAREWLDSASGVTVLADVAPIVFARTETRYSRSARDYLYLGPIETNRQGVREYYLWVGMGTTLDRGYLAPPSEIPDSLYIGVQGEVMELKLRPWLEREPRVAAVDPYRTAVHLQSQLAARITLNQLMLLAAAPLNTVQVGKDRGSARAYFRWDEGLPPWSRFLAQTGAGDQ